MIESISPLSIDLIVFQAMYKLLPHNPHGTRVSLSISDMPPIVGPIGRVKS